MALPRFERLPPERQREMIAVAARHFADHGYEGAALNQILAELSLSKGAAYYYFSDKADLFCTVVEAAWARFAPEVDALALVDRDRFWPSLEALWLRQVDDFDQEPELYRVTKRIGEALRDPAVAATVVARLTPALGSLRALLHHGQAQGVVRTDLPEDLLAAMIGGLDHAIDTWLLGPGAALEATERRAFARVAFASLRALASPQGGL